MLTEVLFGYFCFFLHFYQDAPALNTIRSALRIFIRLIEICRDSSYLKTETIEIAEPHWLVGGA
jgi:hypothetical protein